MQNHEITIFYLEMTSPDDLRPATTSDPLLRVEQASEPYPELSRFFYTAVGGQWYWLDRLDWNHARWQEHIQRPAYELWIGWYRGTPAGYFELERSDDVVEIAYFGLIERFIGRGLGGVLLTAAIQNAWASQPRRVIVNTCTLDGPAALRNYQARGFRQYDTQVKHADLADSSPGPWPGWC